MEHIFGLNSSPAPLILVGACGLLFFIQLYFLYSLYAQVHRARKPLKGNEDTAQPLPPLSVVIVTKDAGDVLKENLTAILEQDYPDFEVIVVNERPQGTDEDLLKILSGRYDNLYHTFIPDTARYVSLKKLGIAMGIKASRHEWIVVTEPACKPASRYWLRSMAACIRPETDIVLGYCGYDKGKGFFARRMRTDNLFCALRYLGRALKGHPYMGSGRNLAYRKSCYQSHKGFASQLTLLRGEDDLFVNAIATKENTRVCLDPEGFMHMPLPPYKRIWFNDKLTALVTGHYYRGGARFLNAIDSWTCFLYHLCTVAAIAVSVALQAGGVAGIALLLWLARTFLQMQVFTLAARDMQEPQSGYFFVFDLLRPLWSLQMQLKYQMRNKSEFLRKQ